MEVICRSESSGIAVAAALEPVWMSVLQSMVMEKVLGAGKSLLWLLFVMGSSQSGVDLLGDGCEIIKGFPLLRKIKGEPMPENKDAGESDDEDEEDEDDDAGEEDDDAGEEDYSGDEGNKEDDEEEELEANGGGGSEDEDDDDEDDDDDDGDDDDDDDDEDGEEEEDEDQPPPKKRK